MIGYFEGKRSLRISKNKWDNNSNECENLLLIKMGVPTPYLNKMFLPLGRIVWRHKGGGKL
jgi:hypothetical protein